MDSNNKICNTKTEVPSGIELNDKDYINCLLTSLKEMIKNYSYALTEASNENLFNNYKEMFERYIKLQREVYELIFRNGWYCLEKIDMQKIDSKIQMLSQELASLEE